MSIRQCSRLSKCGTILDERSDVSEASCGCLYCTGCLSSLQELTTNCELCNERITGWTRTWPVALPNRMSLTWTTQTETKVAFPRSKLEDLHQFVRDKSGTEGDAAHVVVVLKEDDDDDDVEGQSHRRHAFISETLNNNLLSQRKVLGVLAFVLRKCVMEPELEDLPQLPVSDLTGFIDRALSDSSDMAHFFRILYDPHAGYDDEVPQAPDSECRRHALASYVSLELLRRQIDREHRHPLQDWMVRTLGAQRASTSLASLLTKLSFAAKEAAPHVAVHEGDVFSSLRARVRIQEREKAFRHKLSLKLHDFDNIGFTKKGKKVGYEQFIASAWKE